ncbi:bifunctional precorrin-2 dehydrogenase/sirohydrochlorin ferrochelatase [Alkalibaculum sp. M08DMB]|uniref:precorrin-2 dehydrogenase n=1 Tax=Alkalibaculum sporogenes TaxID=2655001 RepID=A0A6A7KA94_9FIRM|nr:bifunctional precorrin-2 dehydrogenase/sirohydrochlorin ferrochelatase [Alkalibaculum sporogenes]MPW26275.1 bifunctional precorrin-2 dehydrogenase/sirohydrochlorin ferrochelatase [Alkalibaculum sporogenes]
MYYPVLLEIENKKTIIFGGGKVAYRKSQSILQCDGKVTLVSKEFREEIHSLKRQYPNLVTLINDKFQSEYITDCYLVIAATNSSDINEQIHEVCKAKNIFCNRVDNGNNSDYIVPSVIRRGDLIVSVSTSGKSPTLSINIKKKLEQYLDDDIEEYIHLLGVIREKVIKQEISDEEKKSTLKGLVKMDLEELKNLIEMKTYTQTK